MGKEGAKPKGMQREQAMAVAGLTVLLSAYPQLLRVAHRQGRHHGLCPRLNPKLGFIFRKERRPAPLEGINKVLPTEKPEEP